jgi:methyltransferase OMS1
VGFNSRPRSQKPSSPPPPPPPKAETLLDHWRTSWLPLTGAALFAGLLGFYIFGTATASICAASSPCGCIEHSTPTGRPPALTGDNAEQFDKELNWPEWLMGITSLRKRLAERAKGEVLELAMGSGRNLEYYDWTTLASAATTAANANGVGGKAEGRNSSPAQKIAQGGITSFTGLDISAAIQDVTNIRHHHPDIRSVFRVPPRRRAVQYRHGS